MSDKPKLPGWLKPANRVIMFLNRLGLTIPRRSRPPRRSARCSALIRSFEF